MQPISYGKLLVLFVVLSLTHDYVLYSQNNSG